MSMLAARMHLVTIALLSALIAFPAAQARGRDAHAIQAIDQADFRLGEARVAFAGDVMLTRARYRAIAEPNGTFTPRGHVRIALPDGGTLTLGRHDELRSVQRLAFGDEPRLVLPIPRAAALGVALLVREDGAFDGALARLHLRGNDGRAYVPVLGAVARFEPPEATLDAGYRVRRVVSDAPFLRYDVVFDGIEDDEVRLRLRIYDTAPPKRARRQIPIVFATRDETVDIGPLTLQVRAVESSRIQYRVAKQDDDWRPGR